MSKLKIGIFGDSFGYHVNDFNPNNSWTNLLSQDFDVTNFSFGGTSTYFSYKNFLENYHRFDKIIFVTTDPCRIHTSFVPVCSEIMAMLHRDSKKFKRHEMMILSHLIPYFRYSIIDSEIEKQYVLFHNLMIDDIKSLRDEIIFVPGISKTGTICDSVDLAAISENEKLLWNTKFEWESKIDTRQCHMSNPANFWLYEQIKPILSTVTSHTIFNFKLENVPPPDNIDNYLFDYE